MRADCKLTTILDDKTSEQRIEVSSAKIDVIQFEKTGISDVKMLYNTGDRHDPWGHPAIISVFCERVVPKYTLNVLLLRKLWTIFIISVGKLNFFSLKTRQLCHTESKAAFISSRTIPVDLPVWKLFLTSFLILSRGWVVLCSFLNPNCCEGSVLLASIKSLIFSFMIFSSILLIEESNL